MLVLLYIIMTFGNDRFAYSLDCYVLRQFVYMFECLSAYLIIKSGLEI